MTQVYSEKCKQPLVNIQVQQKYYCYSNSAYEIHGTLVQKGAASPIYLFLLTSPDSTGLHQRFTFLYSPISISLHLRLCDKARIMT